MRHLTSCGRVSTRSTILPLAIAALLGTGACAPPFSELQSARMAGQGRAELSGSYGRVTASAEGESEHVQNQFGLQLATGLSPVTDVRIRYERVTAAEGEGALNVLGFGPKFRLVPDRVAFYLPIGFAFGEDVEISDTWQVHPTLLGTVPVASAVEVNGSAKVLFPFDRDIDTTVAFNVGLGIGDFERIVVRPEFGILLNPGEDGHFRHFSIGLTYYTGR